jgi:hypothetical protein
MSFSLIRMTSCAAGTVARRSTNDEVDVVSPLPELNPAREDGRRCVNVTGCASAVQDGNGSASSGRYTMSHGTAASYAVLRQRAEERDLPARRFGNDWRFSRLAIFSWLADGEKPRSRRGRHAAYGLSW